MTVLAMAWALKKADVPTDPLAHLVLIGLADHANDDGTGAFPSVRTLSGYARCSTRSVQAKLRLLESVGLIRRGDQGLVERLPANRRPVVWDLVMDTEGPRPNAWALLRDEPAPARSGSTQVTVGGELAGQPGVKILHPNKNPVDNPIGGANAASPQGDSPVDNPDSGVNEDSPHGESWGERSRRFGVNVSSHKPPLEELLQTQVPRPSTEAIHRPGRKTDRCDAHQHLSVPVPCWACRDVRVASENASATQMSRPTRTDGTPSAGECEHGFDAGLQLDGRPKCPLCRRGLVGGIAPWDAEPARAVPRLRGIAVEAGR